MKKIGYVGFITCSLPISIIFGVYFYLYICMHNVKFNGTECSFNESEQIVVWELDDVVLRFLNKTSRAFLQIGRIYVLK